MSRYAGRSLTSTRVPIHATSSGVISRAQHAVAIIVFASRGAIDWRVGLPMLIAALIGGYFGAVLVRRLNAESARRWVMWYAWGITLWFFGRELIVK